MLGAGGGGGGKVCACRYVGFGGSDRLSGKLCDLFSQEWSMESPATQDIVVLLKPR